MVCSHMWHHNSTVRPALMRSAPCQDQTQCFPPREGSTPTIHPGSPRVHSTRICRLQMATHGFEFGIALHLQTQVIDARLAAPLKDCKIHARVLQHPFGVIGLHNRGGNPEKRGIKTEEEVKHSNFFCLIPLDLLASGTCTFLCREIVQGRIAMERRSHAYLDFRTLHDADALAVV